FACIHASRGGVRGYACAALDRRVSTVAARELGAARHPLSLPLSVTRPPRGRVIGCARFGAHVRFLRPSIAVFVIALVASLCIHFPIYEVLGALADRLLNQPVAERHA